MPSIAVSISETSLGAKSRGSLAERSAELMIAPITACISRCPNMTAPEHHVFESCCASDSTISTASAVPATTQIELRFLHLVGRRVQDVAAVDVADACRADRSHERNAREVSAAEAATSADDVGIVLQVVQSTVTTTCVSFL